MTEREYFPPTRAIITKIEALGFDDEARKLREAMLSSSGLEIAMGLRFHLSALKNDPKIEAETRLEIKAVISQINQAIGI